MPTYTENNMIIFEFGQGDVASTCVIFKEGAAGVSLSSLDSPLLPGEKLSERKDMTPLVGIVFPTVDTIDFLINQLVTLREEKVKREEHDKLQNA